jgi:hypothetical protein
MEHPLVVALLTVVGLVVVGFVVALALAGGDGKRIGLVISAKMRILRDPAFAAQVEQMLAAPPSESKKPKPSGVALRLLALLQREGRLLDFLLEDISAASDEQIASGVREIHRSCQKALKEHLVLEPVLPRSEGETVEVPAGFDPSAIRLTGNVTGQPPFKGTLQHHGWRVREVKLAAPPEGQDEMVVAPAEVELP